MFFREEFARAFLFFKLYSVIENLLHIGPVLEDTLF